jgi:hypothetical protein
MRKNNKRILCEDISPTIKAITSYKLHKHIVEIKGNKYERIGEDIVYCLKTSRIFKLKSLK